MCFGEIILMKIGDSFCIDAIRGEAGCLKFLNSRSQYLTVN